MIDALQTIVMGAWLYAGPLFCGRACIPVGLVLWPAGWLVIVLGIIDLLLAASS